MWKTLDLLRKLNKFLPRSSLVTIYKLFIRAHLDYTDLKFDKAFNHTFHRKLKPLQYNAALAIVCGIKRTYIKKKYQELENESI